MKVGVKTMPVYVADDGVEFESEYDCRMHELTTIVHIRTGVSMAKGADVIRVLLDNLTSLNTIASTQ